MPLSIAIVGSGPSAFYTADSLLKSGLDCRIDLIERLPTPYGLIRGGVAPDHQHTKRVLRAYERTARNERVRFYGNVEVGREVSVDELRRIHDAVVLAVGAPHDRLLGVPGEDKRRVHGSAAFVGWYNGHPDFAALDPDLGVETVAVVGNGNVAIDVARVLVKTQEEMAESDLASHAAAAIHASPIKSVHLIGRRGPVEAKFTNVELREMGHLADAAPIVDAAILPEAVTSDMSDRDRRLRERNLATLREFAGTTAEGKAKRVHFDFCAMPREVLGGARVEGLRLERTRIEDGRAVPTGEVFDLPCGLVIPAIGYRAEPLAGVPFDEAKGIVPNEDGRVESGLYVVGWVKRGPTGVIGTNKPDGDAAARHIKAEVTENGKPGRPALEDLLRGRGARVVSFADWQRIDAAETEAAPEGAPRRKFTTVAALLAALDGT